MENKMEKKGMGRRTKLMIISAGVILLAGGTIYAVSAAGNISEAEAKQVALAQVSGADQSHITQFRKDMDDGRTEYDVEIVYGGYEYDFEISAKDGTIFDQSKEPVENFQAVQPQQEATIQIEQAPTDSAQNESAAQQGSATQAESATQAAETTSDIGLEKAKAIAVGEVSGASTADIVHAYSDYDDGRLEYDVEIRYNGYEYDFEIDGETGKILGKDVDRVEYEGDSHYD